ncbi:MAG: GldG family protein [Elusimicrobia bacterium]|nr:GldG family protein [Elusimicrobiota bacterium]
MDRKSLIRNSSAGAALVIAIAAMLNLFGHYVHLRLDFSRGQVYSMSRASKKLLRALPDPVHVKVFHSKELPPQVAANRDYLRDLLSEYRSGSNGKVRVTFVDVDASSAGKEDAQREGISPVRFDIIARDRYEQREGFLGLSLQYRDKKEAIGFLQDVAGLEYDLTSRIKTLTLSAKPQLALITDHKALDLDDLDPSLRQRLETRYQLRPLALSGVPDDGIPAELQTALFLGPQERLTERELFLLDQFLLSGRSLGVAVDTKRVDMRGFYATDNETGLEDFLAKHGVRVLSTVVLDQQSQPIQIQMQQGFFVVTNVVQYPPFVVSTDLDAGHPTTKGLDSLVLPFVSPVEVSTRGAKASVQVLARSSKYSWAKPDKTTPILLHPFQLAGPGPSDLQGPFGLAVVLEDEFAPAVPEAPKGTKPKSPLAKALKPGRLAVLGSSKVLAGSFRMPPTNAAFAHNLADWLSLDSELIAIRSKTVAFHPLTEIPASRKAAIRYTLIFLPPLVAVAAGLWRWRSRQRRRAERVARFGRPPTPPAPQPAPAQPTEV